MKINRHIVCCACALVLGGVAPSQAAERDVQIRTVYIEAGIIELHNFGLVDEPLDGFRFCTQSELDFLDYTASTGFNGITIEAGTSLFIHVLNDAPAGDPDRINRSVLGGEFETPMDTTGAYALSLFFPPVNFSNGATMADHVQWSLGGVNNATASIRSDEAVDGGLWGVATEWVDVSADSRIIRLTDTIGAELHDPTDYEVVDAVNNPVPAAVPKSTIHTRLETVATGLTAPNWGTTAPGVADALFVTDQDGILWRVDLTDGSKSVFLDLSSRLVTLGIFGPDTFDERGLLGVAFDPDYQSNGFLYTYTSEPVSGAADFSTMPPLTVADHQSVVLRWTVPIPADPASVVDGASAHELLRIDQPQFNHDGGGLSFGPDDMLYISLGDGGGADDRDGQDFFGAPLIGHSLGGNGQNGENVLGAVLRIDPDGTNAANGQYGIPGDNPFLGGDPRVDEIFAYGFRNPFRFSFDTMTGDLIVADVGQNDLEEINLVTSGDNGGWNVKEGTFTFEHNDLGAGFVTDAAIGGFVDPFAQYDHDEGLAIIGGFVYHGTAIAPLAGRYVFGDFARTFSNDGRLFHLGGADEVLEFELVGQVEVGLSVLGFGQDADGEIYLLANATGTPFGTTGVVLRLSTKLGDANADGMTGIIDFLQVLADWGDSDSPADFDGDGTVGIGDFLLVLANWG